MSSLFKSAQIWPCWRPLYWKMVGLKSLGLECTLWSCKEVQVQSPQCLEMGRLSITVHLLSPIVSAWHLPIYSKWWLWRRWIWLLPHTSWSMLLTMMTMLHLASITTWPSASTQNFMHIFHNSNIGDTQPYVPCQRMYNFFFLRIACIWGRIYVYPQQCLEHFFSAKTP